MKFGTQQHIILELGKNETTNKLNNIQHTLNKHYVQSQNTTVLAKYSDRIIVFSILAIF